MVIARDAALIDSPPSPINVAKLGVLFFGVWSLYLFDRIHDSFHVEISTNTPLRHQFGLKHRVSLIFVAIGAAVIAALLLAQIDDHQFFSRGFFIAAITAGYFAVFRFLKRSQARQSPKFPGKEVTIALCFTAGIFLCSETSPFQNSAGVLSLGLVFLFLANCLTISQAESDFDRSHDSQAFFSHRSHSDFLLIALTVAGLVIGTALLIDRKLVISACALILSSTILLLTLLRMGNNPMMVQAKADGALLVPWTFLISSYLLSHLS
tara:strand:- start:7650 stop:8447 length:798 start_codon:yes stop_codon:yes gene_type:complete